MAKVKGIWVFNSGMETKPTMSVIGSWEIFQSVNFTTAGETEQQFTSFAYWLKSNNYYRLAYCYRLPNGALGVHEVYDRENRSWVNDDFKTVDFGSTEQEVSDEFYAWLTANATQQESEDDSGDSSGGVSITYNGSVIASLEAGQTATLPCKGKRMKGDIAVTAPADSGGGGSGDEALIGLIERTATEFTVPEGCTSIGDDAFRNCQKLASILLHSGVRSIGEYAFYKCISMPSIHLPAEVESIGRGAFYNCTALTSISIPPNIVEINNNTFFGCSGLTEVTFHGTPASIAASCFGSCKKIDVINVPWAEGEVANAPWGATNATINYNYTEG